MNKKYYTHNSVEIALIGKSGSSAIGKALLFAQKPYYEIRGSAENVELAHNAPGIWQALVTKTENPTNPIIPVRDPIERFRSACAQDNRTADEQLEKIEAGEFNIHTRPTSQWLTSSCKLAKFPEHIDYIATALGLDEIAIVNDSQSNNGPKPDLTADQLDRVKAVYGDDIALFDSIIEAGQLYSSIQEEPAPNITQSLLDAGNAAFASLSPGKQALWEPVRVKVTEAILSGSYDMAIAILETVPSLYDGMEDDRATFLALFDI